MGMTPASWVVVVVRAWTEDGDLRVRLLRSGPAGATDVALVSSPADAGRRLQEWLEELQRAGQPDHVDAMPAAESVQRGEDATGDGPEMRA